MAFGTVKVDTITTSTKTVTVDDLTANGLTSSDIGSTVQGYDATTLKSAAIGSTVQGYDADTAKTDTAQTFTAGQRGEITTLSSASTVTPNFADSNNFTLTLGQSLTLANPSNCTAGQSGSIFLVQNSSGNKTITFGSYWDFAGGSAPTISTAANAVDRLDYIVRSSTSIHAVVTLAYSWALLEVTYLLVRLEQEARKYILPL